MPRKRLLKTNRIDLDENAVKDALLAIFDGTYTERRASIVFDIKRSTLQHRRQKILKKMTKEQYIRSQLGNPNDSGNESDPEINENVYSSKYTNRQVFTVEQELELEKYIKNCSDLNYGLSYKSLQKLAYDFALALPDTKIPAEWHLNKEAREGWRRGFMERHPTLSLRKPESTSLSRSIAFNKHKVYQFFDNYDRVMTKFKFPPENIYNLDETGVTTVMKPVKVISTTGKKQVAQIASAERGELVTFVGIVNAVGQSLPPVYIFPRVRNLDDFLIGAPSSSLALGNRSGWMTADLFPSVLKHIVEKTKCTVQNPILLLVDNHESHVSLKSVKFAKENGICLLSFPPHTTHRLQPLDVGVFGPFKSYLSSVFNDWLTSNPGKTISVRTIPSLTSEAFQKSFSIKNIVSSFKKTGIWPKNRMVFSDDDFAPSNVTDLPISTRLTEEDETIEDEKENIEDEKENIENKKVNFEVENDNIEKEKDNFENEKELIQNDKDNFEDEKKNIEDEIENVENKKNNFEEKNESIEYEKEKITDQKENIEDQKENDKIGGTSLKEKTGIIIHHDITLKRSNEQNKESSYNKAAAPSSSNSTASCSNKKRKQENKPYTTPEMVRPYPKATKAATTTKKRTPGMSRVYTDTPEKERLEEIENEKQKRKRKAVTKNVLGDSKNTKLKKTSKCSKRKSIESSSSSENDSFPDDNSSDDISDECNDIEEFDDENLDKGDFVLVRFPLKTKMIHYIGQILSINNETLEVKFLRRKGLSNTFKFPDVEDISNVDKDDILSKLSTPLTSGTARTALCFKFPYNFSNLTVK